MWNRQLQKEKENCEIDTFLENAQAVTISKSSCKLIEKNISI